MRFRIEDIRKGKKKRILEGVRVAGNWPDIYMSGLEEDN